MYLSHRFAGKAEDDALIDALLDDYLTAEYDDFDDIQDSKLDHYTPPLPSGRPMSIHQVRQLLSNIGGLASGEIVPVGHYERGVGQIASHRERVQRGDPRMGRVSASGNRAVVMYDHQGRVFMRVFDQNMNPTPDVIRIGSVSRSRLPGDKQKRAVEMERRVKQEVSRVTGIPLVQDTPRGPDIRPTAQPARPKRSPAISRRRARVNRFDDLVLDLDDFI